MVNRGERHALQELNLNEPKQQEKKPETEQKMSRLDMLRRLKDKK